MTPKRKRRRPMTRNVVIGAAALAAALAVAAWRYLHREAGPPLADASDPELVALGAAVYQEHCAACHGRNLEGEPGWRRRRLDGTLPAPPHDATGHTWHHSDEVLFRLTREGPAAVAGKGYRSTMPGFAGVLDDREIRASLAYIKSLWPPDVRKAQERLNAPARE